jgi:hypothetical protein
MSLKLVLLTTGNSTRGEEVQCWLYIVTIGMAVHLQCWLYIVTIGMAVHLQCW